MMKNDNKHKAGFTLIELIAVLTIILVVSVSSIVSYSKILQLEEDDDYNKTIYSINSAAKSYLSVSNLGCDSYNITLDKLRANGLIVSNLVNPKTNNSIDYLNSYVIITTENVDSNIKCKYDVILNDVK